MGQLLVDVPEYQSVFGSVLPAPFVEVIEISEAMVCLCARSGRYITGITLPVDAWYTAEQWVAPAAGFRR